MLGKDTVLTLAFCLYLNATEKNSSRIVVIVLVPSFLPSTHTHTAQYTFNSDTQ